MVGILGLILLKSTSIANHFKEKATITLFLKNSISSKNIESLKASIAKEEFTKRIEYISKEDAAKAHSKELGEDFVNFIGANPLKNNIDIFIKAAFVTPDKMSEIAQRFEKNAYVFDVAYDKPLIQFLTKNTQKISFWLLIIASFFGLVSILLINSSLRLSVYSKRFNIKTMQMVGATKSFIRKPFIMQGIKLGMIGALVALIGLSFVIFYANKYIPELQLLTDYLLLIELFASILIVSFLITWLSTFFATQRFLNLQTDEIHY